MEERRGSVQWKSMLRQRKERKGIGGQLGIVLKDEYIKMIFCPITTYGKAATGVQLFFQLSKYEKAFINLFEIYTEIGKCYGKFQNPKSACCVWKILHRTSTQGRVIPE